jgi:hypothetical protein
MRPLAHIIYVEPVWLYGGLEGRNRNSGFGACAASPISAVTAVGHNIFKDRSHRALIELSLTVNGK